MRSAFRPLTVAALVLALSSSSIPVALSQDVDPAEILSPGATCATAAHICAGYGEADSTWHVGAGAGQYSRKNPDNVIHSVDEGEVDPHGHSIAQQDSYGVHSRLSYRAIVVEDAEGDQAAFVKSDSYLAMDYLARRAGQILDASGSSVEYPEIFHMASHNHSSPYYMTPSPGPWVFQDAFDIRAFEYHARALAEAIMAAEDDLRAAEMGATEVEHRLFKGMIQRKGTADDGTPRGYPDDFGDFGLAVVRFDSIDPERPGPIATLINWGQHPEGLDDHDLITGDFIAPLERFVERATGSPLVFGQGDVGSAEAGPGHPELVEKLGIPARWSHAGHAQAERGAYLLSQDVVKAWNLIGDGDAVVPFTQSFDVEAGNAFLAGPYSHPYPAVSSCRTETTVEGNPGVPSAAACTRARNPDPQPQLWEQLKQAGVPIPDNYDLPSYFALEENMRLKLQAFKLGDVIIASCACEAQVDLILNFESRANDVEGDIWDGFDWTTRMDCSQNADTTWTCRKKADEVRPRAVVGEFTVSDYRYRRMRAQVHNDAKGWDAPENVVHALSEPYDTTKIFGNFTKEELSSEDGYKLAIGVGHAGDYNGYTVSYREFQSWDDYRKSLTSYGPHTADYMVTRMVRLAGTLNGVESLELEADIARGLPDEGRQLAMSRALGATSHAAYEAWVRALPIDKVPGKNAEGDQIVTQPQDIERFEAATFSWYGGSNAIDNPVVTIQRKVDGEWELFADQSGEVQTMLDFPNGINAFADTYSGGQTWKWTAAFEAFNAFPEGIGSTPEGEYRFVVEGRYRAGYAEPVWDARYELASEPFTVSRWDGVEVGGLAEGDDGSVTFRVTSKYPATYDSVFPYVQGGDLTQPGKDKTAQGNDVVKRDELGKPFCTTCSFRPWASQGIVRSVTVTIERLDGSVETVQATANGDGTWTADTQLYAGDRAYVAAGDAVDNYGERNSESSGAVTSERVRPTPTPTPSETQPVATTTSLEGSDGSAQYTDTARFRATVTDAAGNPVPGAPVTFSLVGTGATWSATTDDQGVASVTPEVTWDPGSYHLTATYPGDDDHVGSTAIQSFVVEREDSVLSLAVTGKGSKRALEATLTDRDAPGSGIAGRSVTFFAGGEVIGSATTNARGVAVLDVPARYRGGHQNYEAVFSGDSHFRGSSGTAST